MRVALASVLLAACTESIPIDTTPPPPPGLPDIPDVGFHLPMTSLDAFSYTVNLEVGLDYFNVIVDTGSSSTGIAAAGCTSCTGLHPLYTPGPTGKDKGLSPDT